MARPKKNNADYFTHDADMRNDVKIKALRRKFSHTGYAVWNYLLETLTDSDFFVIEWEEINIELLAADYDVSVAELTEIVDYCVKIGLLQLEGNQLCSSVHKKRLSGVVEHREQQRENGKKGGNPNFRKGQPNPYYNREKDKAEITDGYGYPEEILAGDKQEDKQSKVKESKVNISSSSSPNARTRERENSEFSKHDRITACAQEVYRKSDYSTPEKGCAEKGPPPDDAYEYIPIRQVAAFLKNETGWFEAFCMNQRLDPQFVVSKIDEYAHDLENGGETAKDKRDCKRHFRNWLRKNREIHESRKATDTGRRTTADITNEEFSRRCAERVASRLAQAAACKVGR